MSVIQKSGRRNIIIKDGKVTINGRELLPDEAEQIRQEGITKMKKVMQTTEPSPSKGDSVVIINGSKVTVYGKGVTIRQK